MHWNEVRRHHPQRWLVVEALDASSQGGMRKVAELAVVDDFDDSEGALRAYLELHRRAPGRELYVVHTAREDLEIAERTWLGLRTA